MRYQLCNDKLSVEIQSLGGELCSIKTADGAEYLWQGDEKFWDGQAPNLFPYIGRMTNKSYTYKGKEYHMDIHGFIMKKQLIVEDQGRDFVILRLDSDDETRREYPFEFTYMVHYQLEDDKINISYEVVNRDQDKMYFGLGGHPGFCVPNQEGAAFTDYYLEFEEGIHPLRIGFSEECFVDGTEAPFKLDEGKYLGLKHELFHEDAIVLKGAGSSVKLRCKKGGLTVRLDFPELPYFGIWHAPKTEAPYVCLEPWSSLPSRQGIVEEFTNQDNLVSLEPDKTYINNWSIEIR